MVVVVVMMMLLECIGRDVQQQRRDVVGWVESHVIVGFPSSES